MEALGFGVPDYDSPEGVAELLSQEYWARLPFWSRRYAERVLEQFDDHLQAARTSGLADVIWRAYATHHLLDAEYGSDTWGPTPSVAPQFLGEAGEFVLTDISHYRNLIKHKKSLIAPERLAFNPQAATSDGESMQQVSVARHLIDYMLDQRHLGRGFRDALEMSLTMGSSFMHLGWNGYLGDPTGQTNPVTGNPVYTGDLQWDVLTPFEVAHQRVRSYDRASWHILRTFRSRYDLVAQQLERGDHRTARRLLDQEFDKSDYQYTLPSNGLSESSEQIPVYVVYHDRTPSLPMGRMSLVTGDAIVLYDGPLPFPRAPVFRMAPSEFIGTAIPIADSWSWLALNDVANSVLSPIISRVDAYGNPLVSVPEGADWTLDDFTGYRMHERPPGSEAPVLVDMFNMPPGLMSIYEKCVSEMSRISGIDSVTQGHPSEGINSGSFAALVQAQSINFASDDVEQFVSMCEQSVMGGIQVYQSMASHEMLLAIGGQEGEPGVRVFTRDKVSSIKRVTVKRTNSIMKTTAWKQDAANNLLVNGMLRGPQEYMAIVDSGAYDSLFMDDVKLMSLIRQENAMLLRGEVPPVAELEPFHLHVPEHAALLDMYGKNNPQVAAAVTRHIAETMKQWQKLSLENPGMLQALGVPPLPPPPQVQMMMQQAGVAPPQQQAPQQGPQGKPGPKPAPQTRGVDNRAKMAKQPNMPNMPEPPANNQGA